MAGTNQGHAKKEDQRVMDKYATQCDEEAGGKKRMGAENVVRYWLVDEKKSQECGEDEGTAKHKLYHCPMWRELRNQIPEGQRNWDQTAMIEMAKEALRRILSARTIGGRTICQSGDGNPRSKEDGARQSRVFLTTPPPAPCWESPAAVHVVGRWCSSIMTRNWDECVGCTVRWMPSSRYSAPSREQS